MKQTHRIVAFVALLTLLVTLPCHSTATLQDWPNLDVLDHYPNGVNADDTCPLSGKAQASTEQGQLNALKNQYRKPDSPAESLLLSNLLKLNPLANQSAPSLDHPKQRRFVTVVGYVTEVKPGGTGGESGNGKATRKDLVDTHIEFVLDPNSVAEKGRRTVVAKPPSASAGSHGRGSLNPTLAMIGATMRCVPTSSAAGQSQRLSLLGHRAPQRSLKYRPAGQSGEKELAANLMGKSIPLWPSIPMSCPPPMPAARHLWLAEAQTTTMMTARTPRKAPGRCAATARAVFTAWPTAPAITSSNRKTVSSSPR